MLERTIPALVTLIVHHRPAALRGRSLIEVLDLEELSPARLRSHLQHWRSEPQDMYRARPILVFAAVGQGRADGKISPEEESTVLGKLLTHWALTSTLQAAAGCAAAAAARLPMSSKASTATNQFQPQRGEHHGRVQKKLEATGICGFVTIAEGKGVVANAEVQLFHESAPRAKGRAREPAGEPTHRTRTDANGRYEFHCEPGHYFVLCEALGQADAQ